MSKRFKMKLFTIPSLQMCRPKDLSSFPGNPVPAIYRLSPVNSKAQDIGFPTNISTSSPTSPEHQCKVSTKTNKSKSIKGRKSTSNVPSKKSEFLIDKINEEESETLISCLSRFSNEDETKTENKDLVSRNRRQISSVKKVERVRFQSSMEKNRRKGEKTVRMEEKVKESFAVVKKSKDPYEDFKKSMVEMIREMEISEAEELEQLLQCFLALNSRNYHGVIVKAFMEIWQQMFVWNPNSIQNLQTNV